MDYKIVNWIIILLLVVVFAIWWTKPHVLSLYTKWSTSRRKKVTTNHRNAGKKPPEIPQPHEAPQAHEKWIIVHVEARPNRSFAGSKVVELLEKEGLVCVEDALYRYYVENQGGVKKTVFNVIDGIEPGYIDEAFRQKETSCITMFFVLDDSYDARKSLETMLNVSERLARELDGLLQDSDHSVMTDQTRQHLIDTVDRHILSSPRAM